MAVRISPVPTSKKRILWLHTQPEFYHNLMLDDLARGTGYLLPGMPDEHPEEFDWIAGFAHRGPGVYSQNALPAAAQTVFLRVLPGKEERRPTFGERYHTDWRADLRALGNAPLGPDAIIVSGYGQRTFREVIAACRATGTPVALWSDSNLRADRGRAPKTRVRRCLKRRFLRRLASSVNVLTTANTRGIAYWRYYGGPAARSKIVLSPCYTSYPRLDAARAQDRAAILGRFGFSPQDRILFSATRLVPAKGLDLVIRAFAQHDLARRGWKYLVAGTGPLEAQLKALAGPLLGQAVHLLGFQQPSDNLALMAAADVMILPSRFEPHGIVLNEALAAGTPVVVSDVVGGAFGLVKNGVSGLYFHSEDPSDLARKLQQLEDPSRLAAFRAAARPAFESWYRRTSPMLVAPRVARRLLGGGGGAAGGHT
jgi:glycosyltransferase involved in cell wall biosynthesis